MDLYHTEPDGDRLLPHHHYHGLVLALGAAVVALPDPMAVAAAVSSVVGMVAFAGFWHDGSAKVGAFFSILSGWGATTAGVLMLPVSGPVLSGLVILGGLVSLDDTIQHATGFPTPLDQLWKRYLRGRIPGWPWWSDETFGGE